MKNNYFADDGWAFWIDGDDTSTVYLNDWISPKGETFADIAVHIRGIRESRELNVYFPFPVSKEEIEDISLKLERQNVIHAIFGVSGIIEYMKNDRTSELAYNGKVIDIVHLSGTQFSCKPLAEGTLMTVPFAPLQPCLENDEAYFMFRVPHRSLDQIFHSKDHNLVKSLLGRLQSLITSPLITDRYGYAVRINETRILPPEITSIGAFHRQKLKKAAVSFAIPSYYEVNESGAYRVRRLEQNLYEGYLPAGFDAEDAVVYQWNASRDENLRGHFNFNFTIRHDYIKRTSMLAYVIILILTGAAGSAVFDLISRLIG